MTPGLSALVPLAMRPAARRVKRAVFSFLHAHGASRRKVAFGERNHYGFNPFYTTIDVDNADVCINFNDRAELPFPDSSVDVVFSSHALEHLSERKVQQFLAETIRILRPDGMLLVELPDCEYLYKAWQRGDRGMFDDFLCDEQTCREIGHPEIHGRRDIAFGGIVSCRNRKLSDGEYHHLPVVFEAEEFSGKIASLGMDPFFDWLLGLQTEEEALSGGHVSAWYPSKFRSALAKAGFGSLHDVRLPDRLAAGPFVFRNSSRTHYSFRTTARKPC